MGKETKRPNGEGCLSGTPGDYSFRVSLGKDPVTGNRIRKVFKGKTQGECKKKYREYMENMEKEQKTLANITLADWLDKWIALYKEGAVSAGTVTDYKYSIMRIKEHPYSKMKLFELKPVHIVEIMKNKCSLSQTVLKKMRLTLNAAFEAAIDNDICTKNPVKKAPVPNSLQEKHEKEAFALEDVRDILQFARENDDPFCIAIHLLFLTGVRRGELLALKWSDIDFDQNVIHIHSAVKSDGEIGEPKTEKSKRDIPISKTLWPVLMAESGKGKAFVLESCRNHLTKDQFRERYLAFFKRFNEHRQGQGLEPLKVLTTHATRHTFGTNLYRSGVALKDIQALMGHTDISVTGNIYVHADPEKLRESINQVNL